MRIEIIWYKSLKYFMVLDIFDIYETFYSYLYK